MSFSRTHLFSSIYWDVENLNFRVFVPDPTESGLDVYGDGTSNIYYDDHIVPDGYAYLDRTKTYFSADDAGMASAGLYDNEYRADGTTLQSNYMPPGPIFNPGWSGVYVVYTTNTGEQFAPYVTSDQLDDYDFGESQKNILTRGNPTGDQSMMIANVASVRIDGAVAERFAELGVSDAISNDTFVGYLKSYRSKNHKIAPGMTWNGAAENSRLRAHIMWAPYVKVRDAGLSEGHYIKPFDGLLRLVTAIPIAPPHRDPRGFYDKNSDFHYLMSYRIFGYNAVAGGAKRIHPIAQSNGAGGSSNMIVPEALLGNNPPKPYDVDIPSKKTFDRLIDFLQPSSEQINRFKNDLGEVNKFFTGVPWNMFQISYGFSYSTHDQAWPTFDEQARNQKIHSIHPRNPYAGSFVGGDMVGDEDVDDASPRKYRGFLHTPSALLTDELARRNDEMANDSRLFYKHNVANFMADNNVNENRYDVSYVKCGRLGLQANGICQRGNDAVMDLGMEDFSRDEGQTFMKYLNPKKVDADSLNLMVHKLCSPRPYNGEELKISVPFDGHYDAYFSHDGGAWPDITAEFESAAYEALSAELKTVSAYHRNDLESSNTYRMQWATHVADNAGAMKAAARDRRLKLMYYGQGDLQMASAFARIAGYAMQLNKMWTYDDTPKEARIRMQKNRQLDKGMFTAITDSSLDMNMEEEYKEFLGRQLLQDRVLSLGGTFTEAQIREAEERMGVEKGTYDSRIGTATELGSGRGDY